MIAKIKPHLYAVSLILCVLLAAPPLWAKTQTTASSKETRREKRMKALQEKRMEHLQKQLGLEPSKAEQVSKILMTYNEKRQSIAQKRRKKVMQVKEELDTEKPNTRILDSAVKEIQNMDQKLYNLRLQQNREINQNLTSIEKAKFLVFQQKSRRAQRGPRHRRRKR